VADAVIDAVIVMLVKTCNARAMEAYRGEHVVVRVFLGRQDEVSLQIRTMPFGCNWLAASYFAMSS
jgi:hypothetical protein